ERATTKRLWANCKSIDLKPIDHLTKQLCILAGVRCMSDPRERQYRDISAIDHHADGFIDRTTVGVSMMKPLHICIELVTCPFESIRLLLPNHSINFAACVPCVLQLCENVSLACFA